MRSFRENDFNGAIGSERQVFLSTKNICPQVVHIRRLIDFPRLAEHNGNQYAIHLGSDVWLQKGSRVMVIGYYVVSFHRTIPFTTYPTFSACASRIALGREATLRVAFLLL